MRPMQAPVPPSDRVLLTLDSGGGWAWAAPAIFGVPWLAIGIGAAFEGSPVSLFLLPLGALFGSLAAVMFRLDRAPTVLTTSRLIRPRLVRGWEVVELRSVAGVGLRYHDPLPPRIRAEGGGRAPCTWRLAVWRTDVSRMPLPLAVFARDLPSLPPTPDAEDLLVLSQPLADSWPGQVARQIVDQIDIATGLGDSEYERCHYERSAHAEQFEKAWWSTDGSMGLLR